MLGRLVSAFSFRYIKSYGIETETIYARESELYFQ